MKKDLTKEVALKKSFWIFLIFMAIGVGCIIFSEAFGELVLLAFFLGVTIIIISLIVWLSERTRIKHNFCPDCGQKYNYDTDVSWEIEVVVNSNNREKSEILFECICGNCNKTFEFREKFTTAQYVEKTGTVERYNIKNKARNYFKM